MFELSYYLTSAILLENPGVSLLVIKLAYNTRLFVQFICILIIYYYYVYLHFTPLRFVFKIVFSWFPFLVSYYKVFTIRRKSSIWYVIRLVAYTRFTHDHHHHQYYYPQVRVSIDTNVYQTQKNTFLTTFVVQEQTTHKKS